MKQEKKPLFDFKLLVQILAVVLIGNLIAYAYNAMKAHSGSNPKNSNPSAVTLNIHDISMRIPTDWQESPKESSFCRYKIFSENGAQIGFFNVDTLFNEFSSDAELVVIDHLEEYLPDVVGEILQVSEYEIPGIKTVVTRDTIVRTSDTWIIDYVWFFFQDRLYTLTFGYLSTENALLQPQFVQCSESVEIHESE